MRRLGRWIYRQTRLDAGAAAGYMALLLIAILLSGIGAVAYWIFTEVHQ